MPKAKREPSTAIGAAFAGSGVMPYHLPPPLQYTPFQPLLSINGKNVASSFGKSDVQLWWGRRADDELWEGQRGWKRSVMMGDESSALLGRPVVEPTVINGISRRTVKGKMKVTQPQDPTTVESEEDDLEDDPISRILVIHPGARTVRLGRASDLTPVSVPNVVARKCDEQARCGIKTNFEPHHDLEATEAYDNKLAAIRADLRSRMRVLKLRGTTNGQNLAASFNAEVTPEPLSEAQDPFQGIWTPFDGRDTYIGGDALNLPPSEGRGYIVRWPITEGGFNAGSDSGYISRSEILADIEAVWLHGITELLGIAEVELKDYSVILVVPDLYDHIYLREMIDLLFRSIGFKQILIQQESLCACFGAGLGTACVVDVGASKASIACVEEGSILAETRMRLAFGGDDITVVLTEMLRRQNLPCSPFNLNFTWDFSTMENIKEQMVVLSEGDVGLNVFTSYKRRPEQSTLKFEVRAYDEVIIAPMALFAPRIIDFDRKTKRSSSLWCLSADLDDIIDLGGDAVTEAMRSCTAHLIPSSSVLQPPTQPAAEAEAAGDGPLVSDALPDDNEVSIPGTPRHAVADANVTLASNAQTRMPSPEASLPSVEIAAEASKIPLHIAVAESIMATGSEDRAKRMVSALMVVGGGAHIHNIGYAIASRFVDVVPAESSALMASMRRVTAIVAARWPNVGECIAVPAPREIDPRELAWKGVALMSRLDAINDLWIRTSDFEALGYKAVRERLLI